MDSLDIRAMLTHVGNSTPCPICKAKIPSSAIEIVETAQEYCSIRFSCDMCKEDFSGQIQMKKISPLDSNKKLNASSRIEGEPIPNEEISENEVQAMHNALDKNISFETLFGGDSPKKKDNTSSSDSDRSAQ